MNKQSRQVIAASISPFQEGRVVPPNVLAASFAAVFLKAWEAKNIQLLSKPKKFEGALFTEGPQYMIEAGGINIFSMPIEMIDVVAETFLALTKGKKKGDSTGNVMVLALGSSTFCQDIIRFVALDRTGQVNPSVHTLTDRVAGATAGQVVWTDTKTGDLLHEGDLIAMFGEAKRSGLIPD